MKYSFRIVPVTILVVFFLPFIHAQTMHLPDPVMKQLQQRCPVCNIRSADSLQLVSSADAGFNVNFHNCIVSLKKDYPDEAYQYALNAIASIEKGNEKTLHQYMYFVKSKILYHKQLYNDANTGYQLLLKNYTSDSIIISNIYANIAELNLEQEHFVEALGYFDAWQRLFLSTADYTAIKSYYQNKALCLFHLARYAEAESLFFTNIKLEQAHHDSLGLAISFMNLANLYYEQYLDHKAIPYFKKALEYARHAGDVTVLKNANLNMAVIDENRKLYPSALQYRKQYEILQDSLWNRDNIWKLAAQERKFAAQLNDNKIRLLEQEARLRMAELKTRQWERNTLLAAALAFLLLSGLAFYAYRVTIKANRMIALQKDELGLVNKTKDRLFSIVAHDLRSPVQTLKTNVAIIRTAISGNNMPEASRVVNTIEKTVNSTYALLDNMLHWALNQSGQLFFRLEKLHLASVVNQVCYDYIPMADNKNIKIEKNIADSVFINADMPSAKIILRNLLDNAIKYTRAKGSIFITATYLAGKCCVQVKDTGEGMDNETLVAVLAQNGSVGGKDMNERRGTGFGLGLCRLMIEKNNGTMDVKSEKEKGTEVNVYFSLIPGS